MDSRKYPGGLVFGLDIGTRSIVGTVGYKTGDCFHVVAQYSKEHETRAMIDGQIHDIRKVGETIRDVKVHLEDRVGRELKDVCIAAAGRVLKTITVHVEQDFAKEQEVTEEDIYALESKGIESAYGEFANDENADMKFYCVGYSVIRYFMNGYPMGNLEGHKAKEIGADLIATFLPDDVVDGLYKAVEIAGLQVANLTLEPIAAIQIAIPEKFRMLNIALVDVGAGTSDISITKEGSIMAYGMIPIAGDALTDVIAQHCLVDFAMAEKIKRQTGVSESIKYEDIMGLPQTITSEEVCEITRPILENMTRQVAARIKELNGDKSVSAVFVVGGGGKMTGYTELLAKELEIQKERVAVRGEEVMQNIDFLEENARKDSLMVTPIGICLSFYEQSNNFIFVYFNKERIKIYDNNKLAVVDAAIQAEFPNDGLFPKRGMPLNYTVNGVKRAARGSFGEAASITVNGSEADIHTLIHANDVIDVKESTAGEAAKLELRNVPEFQASITALINGKTVELPKFAKVNGMLQSGYYEIQENDAIEILNYYTVEQVLAFMDLQDSGISTVYVNNIEADKNTRVFDNFTVRFNMDSSEEYLSAYEEEAEVVEKVVDETNVAQQSTTAGGNTENARENAELTENSVEIKAEEPEIPTEILVMFNGKPVRLTGKVNYIYVDVFDYVDFDLSISKGAGIATMLNGRNAQYMEPIMQGDRIDVFWKDV